MKNTCTQNVSKDPQGWKKQALKLQVHECKMSTWVENASTDIKYMSAMVVTCTSNQDLFMACKTSTI